MAIAYLPPPYMAKSRQFPESHLVMVIVMHRNRNHGLLLSELGDHLLGGRARTSRGKTNCQFVAFSEMGKSIALELYVEMRGGKGPGIGCPKSASLCHMG